MPEKMLSELDFYRDFFHQQPLETIYFGGGTPGMIPPAYIHNLLEKAIATFGMVGNPEITLEANPEDIEADNLSAWKDAGVNRLSIGIQSLQDEELLQRCIRTQRKVLTDTSLPR